MDPMQRWTLETSYRAFENGELARIIVLSAVFNKPLFVTFSWHSRREAQVLKDRRLLCVLYGRLGQDALTGPRKRRKDSGHRYCALAHFEPHQLVL